MKKQGGYRPYVYKRADQLGIPVVDATAKQRISITADDVARAKRANSKQCALSRSALRITGVVAAYFFRSTAYLEYPDKLVRYSLPISVQKEIVSFDRARIFAEGIYQLSPPSPANTMSAHRKSGKKRTKRRARERAARATVAAIRHAEPADTPGQRAFESQVSEIMTKHDRYVGDRTISGIRSSRSPEPLPGRSPTRYVHRTQYVRDLSEPPG